MQIRMDKENRELKAHGSYEFPVNISYEQLSRYERGSFSWHWHPEIELTFVLSGQIGYQVNGKSYVLKEGDGIFCNTNALHSGHMIDGMDCVYISTTFAPRFLYGFSNSVIQTRYVEPVLTDMQLASIVEIFSGHSPDKHIVACSGSCMNRPFRRHNSLFVGQPYQSFFLRFSHQVTDHVARSQVKIKICFYTA